ncbi:MAG: phospholipase D-like domain-containing protein [Bacteroidales bacterium]
MNTITRILTVFAFLFIYLAANAQLFEDFEQGTMSSYDETLDQLETGEWIFIDALIGAHSSDKKNGAKSARIRNGHIGMNFDYPNGCQELSFYAANFGTNTGGVVQVSYSIDGGQVWTQLGDAITLTSDLQQYTLDCGVTGNIRLQFEKTAGDRINIDDVYIVDYIETQPEPTILVRINDILFGHQETFNFGQNTGEATATLQIRNGGDEDLIISDYSFNGDDGFSLSEDIAGTLASLETVTVNLVYESTIPGNKSTTLTINSNDSENPSFEVNILAETLDNTDPIPIDVARDLPPGTSVTVAGIVTVAHQFAGPVYIQDETGGIAWYSNDIMREEWLVGAVVGDSIVLTGEIGEFYGLMQIVNQTDFEVVPETNTVIEPLEITLDQLNSGDYQGMLVSINEVEFSTESSTFSGNTNYDITDLSGTGQVRIDGYTDIPDTGIPTGIAQITGVAGHYNGTEQLLPRFTDDIVDLSGPVILSLPPYEVSSTHSSITFEWETQEEGHSEIRYGTTSSLELGNVVDEEPKTTHSLTINGLEPATAYKVQLRSAVDTDTSTTAIYISSTASPVETSGQILTYFNKDVVHELATIREADGNTDFSQKLIEYIQLAEETAEFAFYSLSGDVGAAVVDEIIQAHNRGVDVRVIATGHTGTENPLITELAQAGVKAVQSLGNEQMHNKFAVIDAHHSDPSKTWIITSSWNATDEGTYDQFQNMLVIQDVAVARAYWHEFNQMWGGESGSFNSSSAQFGPYKKVVNPSVFWVGEDETRIEVHFSPQANAESHMIRNILTANSNIDLALNLISRKSLVDAMKHQFDDGAKVRGTVAAITLQGSQWDYLSSWADVHHFSQADFGLLHHKYAIIDGEATGANSKIITGSHNWSSNANFSNDENTIIIQDQRVANEYFQEFAARYWQAGGEDEFEVSVWVNEQLPNNADDNILLQNYPNPVNHATSIGFNLNTNQKITLKVYDITGRCVSTLVDSEKLPSGSHTIQFDASTLSNGTYIYTLKVEDGRFFSKRMSVIR